VSGAATAGLTLAALVAFAANSILCRRALADGAIDAASFTAVRLTTGAAVLVVIVALRGRRGRLFARGRVLGGVLLAVYALGFSYAYVRLDAGTGALILFAAVQATMLAGGLAGGERPRPSQWLGLAIASAGLVVLLLPGAGAASPAGAALMAAAGAAWGLFSLRGRAAGDPVEAIGAGFLAAVPFGLVALAAGAGELRVSAAGLGWASASGALASGLGYVVWYAALRHIGATRAAAAQLAVPVLVAAAGVALLGETVSLRMVAASAAVLGGVALATLRRPARVTQRGAR
jgi:drug/metabolite transporter (DMT)-like permease